MMEPQEDLRLRVAELARLCVVVQGGSREGGRERRREGWRAGGKEGRREGGREGEGEGEGVRRKRLRRSELE